MDEQWSFVGSKQRPRWLWYTIDHAKNTILAYAFGRCQDSVFKVLKKLFIPFQVTHFYTDDWATDERHLEAKQHTVGKMNTQKIERKNLNLRNWIKRLARKTICFSKSDFVHDTVIGYRSTTESLAGTFMLNNIFVPLPFFHRFTLCSAFFASFFGVSD
jgi:insertion element IS1 protein InsB